MVANLAGVNHTLLYHKNLTDFNVSEGNFNHHYGILNTFLKLVRNSDFATSLALSNSIIEALYFRLCNFPFK